MPKKKPKSTVPVVVKRSSEERKRLPPELEAFAQSDETRLKIRRPRQDRGLVDDPRDAYAIAGVKNADVRLVYDVRTAELVQLCALAATDADARRSAGRALLDVARTGLYRAKHITGLPAYIEQVLGLSEADAHAWLDEAEAATGVTATLLTEREVALWLRTEAGLYEGDRQARVSLEPRGEGAVLRLEIDVAKASLGLSGVGAKHMPLAREERERAERRVARAALFEEEAAQPDASVEAPGSEREQSEDEPVTAAAAEEPSAAVLVERADRGDGASGEAVPGGAKLLRRRPSPSESERPADDADADADRPASERGEGEREGRVARAGARRFGQRDRPLAHDHLQSEDGRGTGFGGRRSTFGKSQQGFRSERPGFDRGTRGRSAQGEGRFAGRGDSRSGDRRNFAGGEGEGRSQRFSGKSGGRFKDNEPFADKQGGRFGGQSARFGGKGAGRFGGKSEGRFGGKSEGRFGGKSEGRFGGKSEGRFGGKSEGRFGGKSEGRFGGKSEGRFGGKSEGRFGGKGEGRFGGKGEGRFGGKGEGRFGGKSEGRFGGKGEGRSGGKAGERLAGQAAGRFAKQAGEGFARAKKPFAARDGGGASRGRAGFGERKPFVKAKAKKKVREEED